MPSEQVDPRMQWRYGCSFPGADYRLNPVAVESPQLVESIGTDGRVLGAIRPFPGMAGVDVHGIPTPAAGKTVTSVSNIILAQYVSIDKGLTGHSLRGIAFVADSQGGAGVGKGLYFSYYDTEEDASDVVELEDFDQWTDFKLTSLDAEQCDITCDGQYIYFSASADTTGYGNVAGKEPPYNKAYFWDYQVNDWDDYSAADFKVRGRLAGTWPPHLWMGTLPSDVSALSYDSVETSGDTDPTEQLEGLYTFGVVAVSRKHKLRSPMRIITFDTGDYGDPPYDTLIAYPRVGGLAHVSIGSEDRYQFYMSDYWSSMLRWGMPHIDGIAIYKTQGIDRGNQDYSGLTMDWGRLIAPLHLISPYYSAKDCPTDIGTVMNIILSWDENPDLVFPDPATAQQEAYDFFIDEFGAMPRLKRIASYDGLLVGVSDPVQPTDPDELTGGTLQRRERLVWSTATVDEPENFPFGNVRKLDEAAEKFLALETGGDYLFAVTTQGVVRMARSGSQVGINRLQFRGGGTSRHGQSAVGNTLYMVTKAGVKALDGNTGAVQDVAAMNRIILDDSEWGKTLHAVQVEYDASLGALIFLNTEEEEMFLLWESTGAVTKVVGIPYDFVVSGPDILDNGPQRAYFILSDGTVHCIDSGRENTYKTMSGITSGDVNVEVVSYTKSTGVMVLAAGTTLPPAAQIEGWRVYIIGDSSGVATSLSGEEWAIIESRDSNTQMTMTDDTRDQFTQDPAEGDLIAISPVVTRVTFPALWDRAGRPNPFVAKITKNVKAAFSDIGGAGLTAYGLARMGFRKGGVSVASEVKRMRSDPDNCTVYVNTRRTNLFPYLQWTTSNVDFELQAIEVSGVMSISEAQSRQG